MTKLPSHIRRLIGVSVAILTLAGVALLAATLPMLVVPPLG